jgi:hypothetical protein
VFDNNWVSYCCPHSVLLFGFGADASGLTRTGNMSRRVEFTKHNWE